jgi:hypothetical protein
MEIAPSCGCSPRSSCRHDVTTIDRESSMALSLPRVQSFILISTRKQLSFALGTPIPLFLEVRNCEATSFDPESIDIRLVRSLTTRGLTGGVRRFDVARAVLWPAQGSSPHRSKLWGEILVGKFLTPSFDFSKCSVRVRIISVILAVICS